MQVKNDFFIIGFHAAFDLIKDKEDPFSDKAVRKAEHYYLRLLHCFDDYVITFPCSKEILEKYMHAEKISIEFKVVE